MEKVCCCRTINFWPVLPVRLIVVCAKLNRIRPHFGFLEKNGKTFFVIGGFRYFIGLRMYSVKINVW